MACKSKGLDYDMVLKSSLIDGQGEPFLLKELYPNFNPESRVPGNYLPYLHYACGRCHISVASALVICGASLKRQENGYGLTPLHCALMHKDVCQKMIEWILIQPEGALTVNYTSHSGMTALHQVACDGNVHIIRLLLEHGADPTQTSEDIRAETPAEYAERQAPYCHNPFYPRCANTFNEYMKYTNDVRAAANLLERHRTRLINWPVIKFFGEWRPHNHWRWPHGYRQVICILSILAKSRGQCASSNGKIVSARYPQACLTLLPEELLQELFVYICESPFCYSWK